MSDQKQRDSIPAKLDRAKPENAAGSIILHALAAAGLWFTFDDSLAESLSAHGSFGNLSFIDVLLMTLFLCVVASAGRFPERRSD